MHSLGKILKKQTGNSFVWFGFVFIWTQLLSSVHGQVQASRPYPQTPPQPMRTYPQPGANPRVNAVGYQTGNTAYHPRNANPQLSNSATAQNQALGYAPYNPAVNFPAVAVGPEGGEYGPTPAPGSFAPQNDIQPTKQINPNDVIVVFEDDGKQKNKPAVAKTEQISVDFVNEDIKQVLRYVSELYDLNIVIPTSLEGKVSIRLKNVTWEALLESVLAPVGCTYIQTKNILQIRPLADLEKEPLKTDTFLLKFSDAKKIAEELKEFIDTLNGGRLSCNERSNILIITERPKRLQMLSSIIQRLDQPEKQVMIEAKFIEISNREILTLGAKWPSSFSFGISEGKREYKREREGVEPGERKITRKLTDTVNFTTGALKFSADLTESNNFGKVLSNPTVVTMNNVPAEMKVVQNFPIPKYSFSLEKGSYEISGFDEKPFGIELKVTPKIQEEFVTLRLEPKLTEKFDTAELKGGSTTVTYPIINEKKTDSTVTIKSGYTIAIGGLISQTLENNTSKTPFLSSLPILGTLFSHKNKEDEIKNLLIFLTATQIGYDGQLVYNTPFYGVKNANPKQMHDMRLTHEELPGYRYSPQEEARFLEVQRLRSRVNQALENRSVNKASLETKKAVDRMTNTEEVVVKSKRKRHR